MFRKINFVLSLAGWCMVVQATAQTSGEGMAYENAQYPKKEIASLNSGHAEVRPLITEDGKALYFCRRYHPENARGDKDFQDVWVSYMDTLSNQWTEPKNLGPVINNRKRNAIASISPDGMDGIFFNTYKKTRKLPLVRSRRSGDSWTKPQVMRIENYVNVSDYADFYMDFRNKVLFLAIEGDTGEGNQDLYISFLDPYGGWKEPLNLGKSINTPEADFAPFMASDGRSLFFCSYGHDGLGGSDIYMSVRLDDSWLNWSDPVNLGPAVNTPLEETYFSIKGDFEYLYYSSYHPKDKNRNILEVELPDDFAAVNGPVLVNLDSAALSKIMLSGNYELNMQGRRSNVQGFLFEGLAEEKKEAAVTAVEEPAFEKVIAEEIAVAMNEETAKASGKDISKAVSGAVTGESSSPVAENSSLSAAAEEMKNYLEKALPELSFEIQQKQGMVEFKVVQNLLYEFNSVFVSPEYLPRLRKVTTVLRERPELKVQLIGHTDNVGEEAANIRVAEQRVKNLVVYFNDRRIAEERIEIIGAGQASPLESNESEEGRIRNRRVETIIRFME